MLEPACRWAANEPPSGAPVNRQAALLPMERLPIVLAGIHQVTPSARLQPTPGSGGARATNRRGTSTRRRPLLHGVRAASLIRRRSGSSRRAGRPYPLRLCARPLRLRLLQDRGRARLRGSGWSGLACKLQGSCHGLQAASTVGLSGSSSSSGMGFTCVLEIPEQLGSLAQERRSRQHRCMLAAFTWVHSNRALCMRSTP